MMKNLTVQLKIIIRPEKDKSLHRVRYFIGHLEKINTLYYYTYYNNNKRIQIKKYI